MKAMRENFASLSALVCFQIIAVVVSIVRRNSFDAITIITIKNIDANNIPVIVKPSNKNWLVEFFLQFVITNSKYYLRTIDRILIPFDCRCCCCSINDR